MCLYFGNEPPNKTIKKQIKTHIDNYYFTCFSFGFLGTQTGKLFGDKTTTMRNF